MLKRPARSPSKFGSYSHGSNTQNSSRRARKRSSDASPGKDAGRELIVREVRADLVRQAEVKGDPVDSIGPNSENGYSHV